MATNRKAAGEPNRRLPPAKTPEGRERQLVALAVDLAEKHLREGTASSQVLSHFLKLATVRERKELERLELEKTLIQAKVDSLQATKDTKKMMEEAINAMRRYSGNRGPDYND